MPKPDRILASLVLGAALLLAGCSNLLKPDAQRVAESRAVYEQLTRDDVQGLQARMSPESVALAPQSKIEEVRAVIPGGKPLHIQTIGWNSLSTGGDFRIAITEQYEYADAYVVFESDFDRPAGASQDQLIGFHVNSATRAQLKVNALTFEGRSWKHYALAAYAVLEVLLILAAVIHLVRNRSKGWILWLIASLFGVCQIRLDWTTGAMDFQLLYISLLGVGITRGLSVFSHWVLSVSIPFFAILVLAQRGKFVRYKKALKQRAAMEAENGSTDSEPSKTEPPGS